MTLSALVISVLLQLTWQLLWHRVTCPITSYVTVVFYMSTVMSQLAW